MVGRRWHLKMAVILAVSPGPLLLEWLGTNPFPITTTKSAGVVGSPRDWFSEPSAPFEILQDSVDSLIFMLSADHKHLYATDYGLGFAPPSVAP